MWLSTMVLGVRIPPSPQLTKKGRIFPLAFGGAKTMIEIEDTNLLNYGSFCQNRMALLFLFIYHE